MCAGVCGCVYIYIENIYIHMYSLYILYIHYVCMYYKVKYILGKPYFSYVLVQA